MVVQIVDTPEKFRPLAEEIVPPLLDLLRARSALEGEIYARWEELEKAKRAAGIAYNQIAPGEPELWAEYRQRYLELVQDRCVPGFLKYGAGSFAKPTKYGYLEDYPDCPIRFIMKSAKKAAVETRFSNGSLNMRHRFTLKPSETGWLVARVELAYFDEETWHVEHYL